jgi:peptidyl-tRNA hydrolase, PTH1 family
VPAAPKLIVGLGNPGIEYQFTYHNLGFLAVDRIADECGVRVNNRRCRAITASAKLAGHPVVLAKPETYMNLSGLSVRELVEKFDADPAKDLVVIYDEVDLELGTIRIRERGSSAGHNGMKSIIGALGTEEFTRIRLGIAVNGRKPSVLAQVKKSQYELVDDVLERTAQAVQVIVSEGTAAAMNRFNRKAEIEE